MKRMLIIGIILASSAALFAALPDGQQYFGRIKDATPIVTNGYTRAQIDAKIDSVKITETDPVFTAWKSGDFVSITNGLSSVTSGLASTNYVDAATNAVAAAVDAALEAHTADTNNPHKVTAAQVGVWLKDGVITIDGEEITPLTSYTESDPAWAAWTNSGNVALGYCASVSIFDTIAIGKGAKTFNHISIALGGSSTASGDYSTALGGSSTASGDYSTALGYMAYAPAHSLGLAYTPDTIYLCSSNTGRNAGSTARSLRSYLDEKATTNAIPDVSKFITADAISATDATFSNAVLAVGLNIDTNTLAAINELATIDYTTPATTVGALLAALAAGLAALKKKTTAIETKVDAANTALEEVA